VLLIRLTTLAALAAALAVPAAADDLTAIKKRGTLRVLVEPDTLAELYDMKGKAGGMEKEILDGFARLQQLKIETVKTPFEDRIPTLQKGSADMIAGGLVASPARREQVAFTHELLPTRQIAVTRAPGKPVAVREQLRTMTVGVVKGGTAIDLLLALGVPRAQIVEFPSDSLLAQVTSGKVGAAIMSTTWAISELRKDPAWQLGAMLGAPTEIAFAVRKDQPELLAALNEYIANLRRTPTWSRLVVKYFGESAKDVLARARQ
jgi:membrane-bound lytic murein transglycosylase F